MKATEPHRRAGCLYDIERSRLDMQSQSQLIWRSTSCHFSSRDAHDGRALRRHDADNTIKRHAYRRRPRTFSATIEMPCATSHLFHDGWRAR